MKVYEVAFRYRLELSKTVELMQAATEEEAALLFADRELQPDSSVRLYDPVCFSNGLDIGVRERGQDDWQYFAIERDIRPVFLIRGVVRCVGSKDASTVLL